MAASHGVVVVPDPVDVRPALEQVIGRLALSTVETDQKALDVVVCRRGGTGEPILKLRH